MKAMYEIHIGPDKDSSEVVHTKLSNDDFLAILDAVYGISKTSHLITLTDGRTIDTQNVNMICVARQEPSL